MGDLKGHAIPGTFFLLYGLWWAISCLRRHLISKRNGTQYVATSTYPLDCFKGGVSRLPIEGFVKVVISAAGMLGELLAHLPVPPMPIVQHATMYFFFLLSGVVDITMHYGNALPAKTDYMSLVVALVVEGLLFVSHIHGRSDLDIHIHLLLVYVVFLTAFVIILEAKKISAAVHELRSTDEGPRCNFEDGEDILKISAAMHELCSSGEGLRSNCEDIYISSLSAPGLGQSLPFMLQGSWFWAVGIILYGHGEKDDAMHTGSHDAMHTGSHDAMNMGSHDAMNMGSHDAMHTGSHESVMQATIFFSWHCAAHFILIVILCVSLFCCGRSRRLSSDSNSRITMINIKRQDNKEDASTVLISDDDFEDS